MTKHVGTLDAHDVALVKADNPGPFTLTGTNTWIVGRDPCWVIDPGPALDAHVEAVLAEAHRRGGVGGVALTHHHNDHTEAVPRMNAEIGDGPLERVPTPGHTGDHVAYVYNGVAFTGDAVLGEGSVYIVGHLADYLDALRALRERELELLCPGHGPLVNDPRAKLTEYIDHRLDRERRLLEALDEGRRTVDDILDAAWDDAPEHLRPAAAVTMNAHLEKLDAEGRLPSDVERPEIPAWLKDAEV